jgi:hypothetical protein
VTRLLAWLRERPALLIACGLAIVAIWETVTIARAGSDAPSDRAWRDAAAALAAEHHPDDLIVFAPHWIDPIARVHVGHLMTREQIARMDATRYGRVWEVSTRGASAPETRGLGKPVYDRRFGDVRLRLWERDPPRVLWDLRGRSKLLEVDYAPRLCVPLPVPRGRAGRLDLGEVQLGSRLVVYAGLSDFRSRKANESVAQVRLVIDEKVAGDPVTTTAGSESGWTRNRIVAATTPGTHHVAIEATGGPDPQTLSLCVAAEAYE